MDVKEDDNAGKDKKRVLHEPPQLLYIAVPYRTGNKIQASGTCGRSKGRSVRQDKGDS